MKTKVLVAVCLATWLAAVSAFGQAPLRAKIPFQFTAGSKVLPAGEYEFRYDAASKAMAVKGGANGPSATLLVRTRLAAAMHTTPADSHIVFDKVGDKHFLSEVWIPGVDGFLLHPMKGPHEHQVVDVPRQ